SSDATDFANQAKIKVGTQHQYGLYAGPTIHYAEEGWWATAGLLFLVESGGNANSNDSVAHNGKAYDEHERFHLGLTMGFEF
ncbi:MAG: hypothetical protein HRT88_16405, partial [Lentisphaeraceae bacterium]|nr:hypothetical protein [Lentisphaeraceae bacterium]